MAQPTLFRERKPLIVGFFGTLTCLILFGGAYILAKSAPAAPGIPAANVSTPLADSTRSQPTPSPASQVLKMTVSNGRYSPDVLTLHQGEATDIQISSTDGIYGFTDPTLGFAAHVTIAPGQPVTISVPSTAPAGTYEFWDPSRDQQLDWAQKTAKGAIVIEPR